MLLEVTQQFCRDRCPIEAVRQQIETEHGFDRTLWSETADLGWLSMAVPEEHGGVGGGFTDIVAIAEPMAQHLFSTPFASTQIVIQALATGGSPEQRNQWLPRLSEGAIAAVALSEPGGAWEIDQPQCTATISGDTVKLQGKKGMITDAAVADVVLVSARSAGEAVLAIVEKKQLPELERETIIDETRRSYRMSLDGIKVPTSCLIAGNDGRKAYEAIRTTALLLNAVDSCGAAEGALQVVLEYMKSRIQFDKPIGSYQGLKHPTVDVMCAIERARSLVYHAATVADDPDADAEKVETSVRMAKAAANDAGAFSGDRAIQFHGGIGFTYQCDAQLFLRRAIWNQYQYGDAIHQRKHLAELLL